MSVQTAKVNTYDDLSYVPKKEEEKPISIDDLEIEEFAQKNRNKFQQELANAKKESEIAEVFIKNDPTNNGPVFFNILKRFNDKKVYRDELSLGSKINIFVMSLIFGKAQDHGLSESIYTLSKDRPHAFSGYDEAEKITNSKCIQFHNKISELTYSGITDNSPKTGIINWLLSKRIFQGSNRFALLLIALGLCSSIILSATSGTIKGVKHVWQEHAQQVKLKEELTKRKEFYVNSNKKLQEELKVRQEKNEVTQEFKDRFTNEVTSNNAQIKSLEAELNK